MLGIVKNLVLGFLWTMYDFYSYQWIHDLNDTNVVTNEEK